MGNELQHHGILGMKWGRRNGPPYPLDASNHSASEKKAGWKKSLSSDSTSSISRKVLDRLKKTKVEKAEEKKTTEAETEEEKKQREAEAEKNYERGKKAAINSGAASEILKYTKDLSTQELMDARNRVNAISDLKRVSSSENVSKVDKVRETTKNITDVIRSGMDLYDQVKRVEKTFSKEEISIGQKTAKDLLDKMDKMSDSELRESVSRLGFYEKIEKSANGINNSK